MIDARTDTHTHRQTQATTIPEGQYWPRVITYPFPNGAAWEWISNFIPHPTGHVITYPF